VFLGGNTPAQQSIVNNRKPDALFNVFFVGDIINVSNATSLDQDDDLLAVTSFSVHAGPAFVQFVRKMVGTLGRCCILRDAQPRDPAGIKFGQVLAHEAGHALDEDDIFDDTQTDRLMFFSASKSTGSKIPFVSSIDMLSSAIKFPP
jgi:hypothetical protein